MFGKLRVWDTAHNNGVLIYLLLAEHAIEIVADRGLNAHVSAGAVGGDQSAPCARPSGPAGTSRVSTRRSMRSTRC